MANKFQGGIVAGSTGISVLADFSKITDNTGTTGLVAASPGLVLSYMRQGGLRMANTAANDLAAVNSAWAAGGIKEVDAVDMMGAYRVDFDDAAFAAGADWVRLYAQVTGSYSWWADYALTTNVIQTGDSFGRIGVAGAGLTALGDARMANLDATVSSRSTFAGGAVASVTGAVGSVTAGVTLAASAVQAIWDALTSALTTVGSIGKLLVTNLDAAMSSRSTYAGADTPGTGTLLTRVPALVPVATDYTAARAAKLDDLDATISSRSTYAGADTPGTTSLLASVAALPQAPLGFKKNTLFPAFTFPMFNPTDHLTPKTGLTVTATRLIDGAVAFAACANPVAEVGATGYYRFDIAAADLNGNDITFNFTAPGGDPLTFSLKTVP